MRTTELTRNLLLSLVASVVTLLVGEAAMRVVVAVFHRQPIVVSDPMTGWNSRPNLTRMKVSVAQGSFFATTDRFGHRIVSSPGTSQNDKKTLAIVGDSFAYGLNVNDSETFAWRISQALVDKRVIDLGVVGWGTDQELIDLERFLSADSNVPISDIVVVVYENDFRDVQRRVEPFLGYHKPVFRLTSGGIDRGEFHRTFLERLMDYSRLAWAIRIKTTSLAETSTIESDTGAPMVMACLDAIRKLGEARGARVTIFAHRRARRASLVTPAVWSDFLTRTGAIDITDAILAGTGPDPVGYDGGHWSAEGHRRAAAAMLKSLQ